MPERFDVAAEPAPELNGGFAKFSLTSQIFKGFTWIFISTAGVKIVTASGQMVLPALLSATDFGLVALAYSVTAFTTVLQKNGLREILVQRQRAFDRYANDAFWISVVTGFAVAGLTLAAGPFGAGLYRAPALQSILVVLAIATPFLSLQSVPGAKLQNEMCFRTLSIISVCEAVGLTGLMLFFAYLGAGALSLVLPIPIIQAASAAVQLRISRFRPLLRSNWGNWRDLLGKSSLLLAAAALYAFNMQGASIILGLFHGVAVVGMFFFANNIVSQLTGLVTNNLWTVLLPSFSQLEGEPARQAAAFKRASDVVSLVGTPGCFGLAAIAGPALHLLYGDKWAAAVPAVQYLSLAAAFGVPFGPAINLIMSQGRYRTLLALNVWRAVIYLAFIIAGAQWGGPTAVAVATLLFNVIFCPAATRSAIRPTGGRWRDVVAFYLPPLAVATVGVAPAWAAGQYLSSIGSSDLSRLVSMGLVAVASCALVSRWIMPQAHRELLAQISKLIPRGSPMPGGRQS